MCFSLRKTPYFPSFSFLVSYVNVLACMSWGGDSLCSAFLSSLARDPHPTCTGVELGFAPRTYLVTLLGVVFGAVGSLCLQRFFARRKRILPLQALLFLLRQRLFLVRRLFRKSRPLRLPLLLPPSLQKGGVRGGGSQGAPCAASVGLPLLPLGGCLARGVEVPLDARPVRASGLPSPRLRGWRIREQLARSGLLLPLRPVLGCLSPLITARSAR